MSSDEDSRPPHADLTSLRVARALLDWAGAGWVAERFSLSTDEVEDHWQRTVAVLTDHYRQKDIAIDDFDSFNHLPKAGMLTVEMAGVPS